jgi:predicted lipid-binding transport protein (Tim44 family)
MAGMLSHVLSRSTVSIHHALLALGAVLVLAVTGYLFHEVRSHPAQAQVSAVPVTSHAPSPAPSEEDTPTPTERPRTAPAPAEIVRKINPPPQPTKINEIQTDDPEEGPAGAVVKLDQIMLQANKAYDRGDFDEAKSIANKVLSKVPKNPRMLRILVSVACIDNDAASALAAYKQLPTLDQEQMRTRCTRYGIDLK